MKRKPWDRQDGETSRAYEIFCAYRDKGVGRSVREIARSCQINERQIYKWKSTHKWDERVDAWDSEMLDKAMRKATNDYARMLERQINNGKVLQDRAMRAIMAMDFDVATLRSLHSVVELFNCGVEMERTAREIAESRAAGRDSGIEITIKDARDEGVEGNKPAFSGVPV